MTETVLMVLIICLTVAFCVFLGACVAISQSKYDKSRDLDGDHDFIDREEFEEYEHMVKERFEALESCKITVSVEEPYKDRLLNAMKDGNWAAVTDIVEKHQEKR